MMIYLKHPVHGVKIASLEAEAKADEKNGWVRFDPDATDPAPLAQAEALTPSPDPASATLTLKRKPGRPRKDH